MESTQGGTISTQGQLGARHAAAGPPSTIYPDASVAPVDEDEPDAEPDAEESLPYDDDDE